MIITNPSMLKTLLLGTDDGGDDSADIHISAEFCRYDTSASTWYRPTCTGMTMCRSDSGHSHVCCNC